MFPPRGREVRQVPPPFTLLSPNLRPLTGPHPKAKNGGERGGRPGACGGCACLHGRSQPSLPTDKPSLHLPTRAYRLEEEEVVGEDSAGHTTLQNGDKG